MTRDDAFKIAFNVTAWFETSGKIYMATGNFDGQGVSWGPRQTCIGQGSLQPLMRQMLAADRENVARVLGPLMASFEDVARPRPTSEQLVIVVRDWNNGKKLKPEWASALSQLGQLPSVQKVFLEEARSSKPAVEELATWIARGAPVTVRMYCLAYDIVTQNGGVGTPLRLALAAARPFLSVYKSTLVRKGRSLDWAWMSVVAGCRALQTRITGQTVFAKDVIQRKNLIIDGEARFREEDVDLKERFGVTDEEVV